MIVDLLRPSLCGEFSCPDGEIARLEGASMIETDCRPTVPQTGAAGQNPCLGPQAVDLPPSPQVVFGLERTRIDSMQPSAMLFPRLTVTAREKTDSAWGSAAMDVLAEAMSRAARANLLTQPVLALAAWRLPDGNFIRPSLPVLLVPNSLAPLLAGQTGDDREEMEIAAVMAVCRLQVKIMPPSSPLPLDTTLALFLSDPIPLYDPKATPQGHHRITHGAWSHSLRPDGTCCEHSVAADTFVRAWKPRALSDADFSRALARTSSFRLVAEISPSSFPAFKDFADVTFNSGSLSRSMADDTAYTPDYADACAFQAAGSSEIAGRLALWDLTFSAPPVPLPEVLAPRTQGVSPTGKLPLAIQASMTKNGTILTASRNVTADGGAEISPSSFPRLLCYPDPDCRSIAIASGQSLLTARLKPHPVLNFAWHWSGSLAHSSLHEMGIDQTPCSVNITAPSSSSGSWRLPAAVWRSAKGNILVWRGDLLQKLDIGSVLCLIRAFRSSGLVATTAPTALLFSDCGIFLLKETASGTLADAGLISSAVLQSPESIRIDGRTVAFTETDGSGCIIEGTKVSRSGLSTASNAWKRRVRIVGDGHQITLSSRALKLGDPEKRKPVAGVALCGSGTDSLEITLFGGDSPYGLVPVARGEAGRIAALWAPPCRFYRIEVAGTLDGTLEAFRILTGREGRQSSALSR